MAKEPIYEQMRLKVDRLFENFFWDNMQQDCTEFIQTCLHCFTGYSGQKIPRPLAATLHGNKPCEVLHFDYLCMGKGLQNYWYILLLKDDFSSYTMLTPCIAGF